MIRGANKVFFIVVIFLFLIASFAVYAEDVAVDTTPPADSTTAPPATAGADQQTQSVTFDDSKSKQWLYNKTKNVTIGDIEERALSTIALMGQSQISGMIEAIRDKEDNITHCWPKGGCKVKDTALATLTLALANQNITGEVEWLKKARIPMTGTPDWWIVIKANGNGTCRISYPPNGNKTFTLEDDKVKGSNGRLTQGQYYISLGDLSSGLAKSTLQPEIGILCSGQDIGSPTVTLIYKPSASTFFIQRSDPGLDLQMKLANACFGSSYPGGSCNYESTAYATWALVEIGSLTNNPELSLDNIGTHIYLENQALTKKDSAIDLGLLNRILYKASNVAQSFIADLVKLQSPGSGSWGAGKITDTSIAVLGLLGTDQTEAAGRGTTYLFTKVLADGSWENNIKATSWALIAIHGAELPRGVSITQEIISSDTEICGNGIDDDRDGVDDCAESECSSLPSCQCANGVKDGTELGVDCGGDCSACTVEEQDEEPQAPEGQPEEDVPEEDTEEVVDETPSGSSLWIWILVILVLLGGGGIFYTKYIKTGKIDLGSLFGKKPKGPSFEEFRRQAEFKPIQQPQRPMGSGRPMPARAPINNKSKDDEELERSIREAQKILKG